VTEAIIVQCTVSSRDKARSIARALVEAGLAVGGEEAGR